MFRRYPPVQVWLSLLCLVILGFLGSAYPETPLVQSADDIKRLLENIEQQNDRVADLSCLLEESFETPGTPPKVATFALLFKQPDKRRKVYLDTGRQGRVDLEIGSDSWHLNHAKSANRTTWYSPPAFIPLPFFRSGLSHKKRRVLVSLIGRELFDEEPCLHFDDRHHEYWVSERDGLLRKKIQKPYAGAASPTRFIQVFREIRANQGVSDLEFVPALRGGTWLEEKIIASDGSSAENARLIPYSSSPQDPVERQKTAEKARIVQERMSRVLGVVADFRHVETSVGTKVGPPPASAAQYISPPSPEERPDLWKTPTTAFSGTMKLQRPDLIHAVFSVESNVYASRTGCLAICDGKTLWESRGRESRSMLASVPVMVTSQSVSGRMSQMTALLESAGKLREWEKKFNPGERRGATMPPKAVCSTSPFTEFKLPDLLIEPFKGLPPESIVFAGEEDCAGEKTWKFTIPESEQNRRMTIWYGAEDGFVRRFQEYDWLGEEAESEFQFSHIRLNESFQEKSFSFVNDGSCQVQPMDQLLEQGMASMLKSMNMPPEDTFRAFFSTSASDVTELQGSGGAFMGYELWIRFRSARPPVLKKADSYKPGDSRTAIAWFSKGFPADRWWLENREQLQFLEQSESSGDGSSGAWFVAHTAEGLYFFRAWNSH